MPNVIVENSLFVTSQLLTKIRFQTRFSFPTHPLKSQEHKVSIWALSQCNEIPTSTQNTLSLSTFEADGVGAFK